MRYAYLRCAAKTTGNKDIDVILIDLIHNTIKSSSNSKMLKLLIIKRFHTFQIKLSVFVKM